MEATLANEPTQYRAFGLRLKAARIRRELTYLQLAAQAGVAVTTLRLWESGTLTRHPRETALFKVADVLQVSAFWLLEGIPPAKLEEVVPEWE